MLKLINKVAIKGISYSKIGITWKYGSEPNEYLKKVEFWFACTCQIIHTHTYIYIPMYIKYIYENKINENLSYNSIIANI